MLQTANCAANVNCSINKAETFSRINVKSARGPPRNPADPNGGYVIVKFGNITQQPIRYIDKSWVYTDGRNNAICVLADRVSGKRKDNCLCFLSN